MIWKKEAKIDKKLAKLAEFYEAGKNQGNSINRFARSGGSDLPEVHRRDTGPWHHGASFRESTSVFPFLALQTLGNFSERILLLLAI